MKKLLTMLAVCMIAGVGCGATPSVTNNVYFADASQQFELETSELNTPKWVFVLDFTATGYTSTFRWTTNRIEDVQDWTNMFSIAATVSGTTVTVQPDTNDLSYPCEDGYCVLTLTSPTEAHSYARGTITILDAPEITGGTGVLGTAAVNWSTMGPHTSISNSFPLRPGSNISWRAVGDGTGSYYWDLERGLSDITSVTPTGGLLQAGGVTGDIDIGLTTSTVSSAVQSHWGTAATNTVYQSSTNASAVLARSYTNASDDLAQSYTNASDALAQGYTNDLDAIVQGYTNDVDALAQSYTNGVDILAQSYTNGLDVIVQAYTSDAVAIATGLSAVAAEALYVNQSGTSQFFIAEAQDLQAVMRLGDDATNTATLWGLTVDVPEYIITGTLTPDATGSYILNGAYGGRNAYMRTDGAYWIWSGEGAAWAVSPTAGSLAGPSWQRIGATIEGANYTAYQTSTGTATVAANTVTDQTITQTGGNLTLDTLVAPATGLTGSAPTVTLTNALSGLGGTDLTWSGTDFDVDADVHAASNFTGNILLARATNFLAGLGGTDLTWSGTDFDVASTLQSVADRGSTATNILDLGGVTFSTKTVSAWGASGTTRDGSTVTNGLITVLGQGATETGTVSQLIVADPSSLGSELIVNGGVTSAYAWTVSGASYQSGGTYANTFVIAAGTTGVFSQTTPVSLITGATYRTSLKIYSFGDSVLSTATMGGYTNTRTSTATETFGKFHPLRAANISAYTNTIIAGDNYAVYVDDFSIKQDTGGNAWVAKDLAVGGSATVGGTNILDHVASTYTPLTRTLTAGDGLDGGGTLAADRSFAVDTTVARTSATVYVNALTNITAGTGITVTGSGRTRAVAHTDSSSQADVDNSGGTVIQDVGVDGLGHVDSVTSYDLDGRYYTETESDAAYQPLTANLTGWSGISTNAGVDETQLDVSINASLDLADAAAPQSAFQAATNSLSGGTNDLRTDLDTLVGLTNSLVDGATNDAAEAAAALYVAQGGTGQFLIVESDTLQSVTGRGATTPTAIVVSNDLTSTKDSYAARFRTYATVGSAPILWDGAEYRGEWAACPEMEAIVFCPWPSATNAAHFYPWVFVSMPGKTNLPAGSPAPWYSEALRIETNGNITLGGRLDMGNYCITNIGDNSLHFKSGQTISADKWGAVTSKRRRAEGPIAALLLYLSGWLGGKRKRISEVLRKALRRSALLLVLLASVSVVQAQGPGITSNSVYSWNTAAGLATSAVQDTDTGLTLGGNFTSTGTLDGDEATDFHDAAQLTGSAALTVITNALSSLGGTNIDANPASFDLDAAAQASDDLADSALQTESDTLQSVVNRGATATNSITTWGMTVDVPEYIVTGTLTPDATGSFILNGTQNGSNLYMRTDGAYWIAYDTGSAKWLLGDEIVGAANIWESLLLTGSYTAQVAATGTATVAANTISDQTIAQTGGNLMLDTLQLGSGETPTNIQATITDDDEQLPTSGAVVDYTAITITNTLANPGDTLLIAEDGSNTVFGGSVGIGTNGPVAKAHIYATTNQPALLIDSPATWPANATVAEIKRGATSLLSVDEDGDVEIKTGNIKVGTGSSAYTIAYNGYIYMGNALPYMRFTDSTAGDDDWFISANGDNFIWKQNVGDSVETERMVIFGDGAVGWPGIASNAISHAGYAGLIAITNSGVGEAQLNAWSYAGDFTQLSAHNPETGELWENSWNVFTGERRIYHTERRDTAMSEAGMWLPPSDFIVITNAPFAVHKDLPTPQARWNAVEHGRRDAALADISAWTSDTNSVEVKGECPVEYKPAQCPKQLKDWKSKRVKAVEVGDTGPARAMSGGLAALLLAGCGVAGWRGRATKRG